MPFNIRTFIGRYFEKMKFTNANCERKFNESYLIKKVFPNVNSQLNRKPVEIVFWNIIYRPYYPNIPFNPHEGSPVDWKSLKIQINFTLIYIK